MTSLNKEKNRKISPWEEEIISLNKGKAKATSLPEEENVFETLPQIEELSEEKISQQEQLDLERAIRESKSFVSMKDFNSRGNSFSASSSKTFWANEESDVKGKSLEPEFFEQIETSISNNSININEKKVTYRRPPSLSPEPEIDYLSSESSPRIFRRSRNFEHSVISPTLKSSNLTTPSPSKNYKNEEPFQLQELDQKIQIARDFQEKEIELNQVKLEKDNLQTELNRIKVELKSLKEITEEKYDSKIQIKDLKKQIYNIKALLFIATFLWILTILFFYKKQTKEKIVKKTNY